MILNALSQTLVQTQVSLIYSKDLLKRSKEGILLLFQYKLFNLLLATLKAEVPYMQKKLFHIRLVSTITSKLHILETSLYCVHKIDSKNINIYLLLP